MPRSKMYAFYVLMLTCYSTHHSLCGKWECDNVKDCGNLMETDVPQMPASSKFIP